MMAVTSVLVLLVLLECNQLQLAYGQGPHLSITQFGVPTAGNSFSLTCTVTLVGGDSEPPVIEWTGPGNIVSDTDIALQPVAQDGVNAYSQVLMFNPLRTLHGGQYTCKAVAGSAHVPATEQDIILSVQIPVPTLVVTRDPDTSVTLRHGDHLTLTCTIQLDPAVDSDVIVTGKLSGPGGTANDVVQISARVYQIVLNVSLLATISDTYNCSTAISPGSGVMNVIGLIHADTYQISVQLPVTITVDYTPPPGFTSGPNEYRAASGPVTVTCTAIGGTGWVSYQWLSTCRDCPFQGSYSSSVRRAAVHYGDTGTHTCTAITSAGITGNGSIEMNVVGAGIHVFDGFPVGSHQNNSLVISDENSYRYNIRFWCRSDAMLDNIGELIGLDGNTVVTNNSFFEIIYDQYLQLRVQNTEYSDYTLPPSEQGVYTCRIPLHSGEIRDINIGIYSPGFHTPPNISSLLFTSRSSSSDLTCISTGSPATVVTWTRDGQPLTIDGNTYQLTQTVTNRRESIYENVLTINNQMTNIDGHIYGCTVSNILGSDSLEFLNLGIEVTGLEQPLMVGETASIKCASVLKVTSIQWLLKDEVVEEITSGQQQLNLTFSPVNDSIHNLQYTCRITANGTEYNYPVTVTVEVPTSGAFTIFLNPHGNPTAGEPYLLTCTAVEVIAGLKNMPSLQWLDSSGSPVQGTGITVGQPQITDTAAILTLTFNPLHTSHAGLYTCRAMLASPAVVGSIIESTMETVLVALPAPTLTITREPDASVTLHHGDNLTLVCTIQLDSTVDNDVIVTGELSGRRGTASNVTHTVARMFQITLKIASLQATSLDTYICTAAVSPGTSVMNVRASEQSINTLDILVELSVTITVDYTPPPGFTPGPNEYRAASGPVTVTCIAIGGTGWVSYQWSSTCRYCPFQERRYQSVIRPAAHYGDTGTHTCTATNSAGITGNGSIEMNVVGAGIHIFIGFPRGSHQNNGLVISEENAYWYNIRFNCRSDAMLGNIGELIGLDGITAVTNNSFFEIRHYNFHQLDVLNGEDSLPPSEQGVYTCRIPLHSGEIRDINIGIYPYGFQTPPNISNLVFTSGSSSSNLTCISTGSPATVVTWTRDGQPLTIDGSTYQLTQTVTNRRESTYENVLTINDELDNIISHIFLCNITNVLGSAAEEVRTLDVPSVIKLEFDPILQALTCTVSATTVTWMKDGKPLTSTYHTVTNRITSIESTNINENVLTLNEPQSNIVGHTYTCIASSHGIKGTSSQDIDIVLPPVEKVTATVVNVTAVNVSWTALELSGWDVSHYTLYYTAVSIRQKKVIGGFSRMLPGNTTSVILLPVSKPERLQHEFHVSATVGMFEGPRSEKASVIFDKEFFQLHIGPVGHCVTWQPEKAKNIEAAIRNAVADAISYQCKCTFPHEFIRGGRFSCRNVTTEAIYRSSVVGMMSHNASKLVGFIQNWVNSKPTVEVEWWLMDVYADCPVRILSLVDAECPVSRSLSSNQTLVTTEPAVIQCVTSCLYGQKGNVCQV